VIEPLESKAFVIESPMYKTEKMGKWEKLTKEKVTFARKEVELVEKTESYE